MWWLTLHLIQTPAIGIVGAGLFVVMARIDNGPAWRPRAAILIFIIYYTVLDSIGGIAVGALITHTRSWTGERRHVAIELVNFLFTNSAVGGTGSIISQLGSWAAFLAFFGVALPGPGREPRSWDPCCWRRRRPDRDLARPARRALIGFRRRL